MSIQNDKTGRVWTVAEAKARLSEILRLSVDEGPQRIGVRRAYVVVPEHIWNAQSTPRKPLGQWLIDNMPRGSDLVIPSDRASRREIPFADGDTG